MIHRILDDKINSLLGGKKAIMVMGARQVGKSTLLHQIFDNRNDVLWLNGDDPDVQSLFVSMTSTRIKTMIGNNKVVIIDEAQRIADIGLRMKLITDQVPNVQLIATGSSSFELASRLNESLAGRKREFKMFPLSFSEMVNHTNFLEEKRLLPHRLVYGYYPEIGVILEPFTQTAYMYIESVRIADVIKSPDIVKYLLPREYPSRIREQLIEYLELLLRKEL
jgi:predicted AAA+ superfamily ATPase